MGTTTIPGVPIASVGMKWGGAGGNVTLTFDHLKSAVAASKDTFVQSPRIKLGHEDPRFADPEDPGHDPMYDGEPAVGTIENLRLVNKGATLTGDLVVPEWLGEVMPFAYPNRSIEGSLVDGRWDFKTPAGDEYDFAVTAVGLLGIYRQAVEDLPDLRAFLTEGDGVEYVAEGVAASATMAGMKLRADVDKILDTFRSKFRVGDRSKWWPRAVYTDPNSIIADSQDGSLHEVPFTSDEDGTVDFGQPTEVLETFTAVPAQAKAATLRAARGSNPVASFNAVDEVPGFPASAGDGAGGSGPADKNPVMDFDHAAALRDQLGLPADATDETIEATIKERGEAAAAGGNTPAPAGPAPGAAAEGAEPPGPTPPPASTPTVPAPSPVDPAANPEPVAAKAGDGLVTMDEATVADLRSKADLGAKAYAAQLKAEDDAVILSAVKTGKFPVARQDHYRALLAADREGTVELIGKLEAGLIPVDERGSAADPGATMSANVVTEEEMVTLFPGQFNLTRSDS